MTRTNRAQTGPAARWAGRGVTALVALAMIVPRPVDAGPTTSPAGAAVPSSVSTPATEAEPAPTSEPSRVSMYLLVHVDLGESDAEVEPLVRQRVRERLHALGLREERGAVRELTVTVRWADADTGASESYAVDYAFATLAEGTPKALASEVCERCGMGELLAMLDRDIGKLRPQLVAPHDVPPPTATATSAHEPADDDAVPPSDRRRPPLATLGKVGVGVAVAGALGMIAGGVLLGFRTKERVDPDNALYLERTSYRMPGIVVLGIGAGVLVAGVAILVVDRVHARRGRR